MNITRTLRMTRTLAASCLCWLAACTDPPREPPPSPDALVARGRYLVDHVADCHACHTRRAPGGGLDESRLLAGIDCVLDTAPEVDGEGCVHSANLTDDPTGLRNRTDAEIEDMIRHGIRPTERPVHPLMPYWMYAHLRSDDLHAIIAYLRTVPGVRRRVMPNEPPHDEVEAALPPLDLTQVPNPSPGSVHETQALHGRYLATAVARCLACHTPPLAGVEPQAEEWHVDTARAFEGGRTFAARALGVPSPPFPRTIATSNLTSHATGLAAWSVEDIVRALREGIDPEGLALCPPMPAGPDKAFGGLSDSDAEALGHYLRSLPARNNEVPNCEPPRGRGPGS